MKLEIDEQIYCLEAVQKASYRFIDRLTILVTRVDGRLICEIDAVEGVAELFDANVANFKRELLGPVIN